MDLGTLLQDVLGAASEAASVIQDVRSRTFEHELKEDRSPVTEADHAADALLKERLLGVLDCGWLSEETADNEDRLTQSLLWVVDPLDGTKEFIKGLPEYSVAIALVEDRRPILGVVHNPVTGEVFAAVRGGGATKNGKKVSIMEGTRLLASRSEIKRGEFAPFESDWDVVATGSIEYKLGLVGAGDASVTFSRGPKHEWDVCAGAIVVEDHYGNEFVSIELETGLFDWAYPSPKHEFYSSPAIASDRVVVGGRDKKLHCLDRANGEPLWTFPTRRKIDSSPVICGDKVVFGSGDGRLYVLRLKDGEEVWQYEIGRSVYSSPAVVNGMILVGSNDGRLYAFGPSNKEKKAAGR